MPSKEASFVIGRDAILFSLAQHEQLPTIMVSRAE
jgi:hypothetical protein